jgi:GntR family negative regulator for fad regulon and positive regulator of fabA
MIKDKKYIRPADFAERIILESIIKGSYEPGDKLPPERELAEDMGITRPTLREVLQRLSREGWITITHGKPTIVNDYKEDGGIGIFRTLAKLSELTPGFLIRDWLEFRLMVLPDTAQKAVWNYFDIIREKMAEMPQIDDTHEVFARFDTELQMMLVKYGNNAIVKMTFNDIREAYFLYSADYFMNLQAKQASLEYYRKLKNALSENNDNIRQIVYDAMKQSLQLWNQYEDAIK